MFKPGDIVLVRGVGGISEVIEDITNSPYSHTAGIIQGTEIIEAQGLRKTGYNDISVYKGTADVYRCSLLNSDRRKRLIELAKFEVGSHYDYLLLFWELIRYKLHISLPYDEGNSRVCSTLWAGLYKEVGVDLCPGIKYPSPGDLARSKLLEKVGTI